MTRAEFIRTAVSSGYADKRTAERYAGERTEFTEADYIEVYRAADPLGDIPGKQWRQYEGAKCTKHLTNIDSDRRSDA